MALLAPVKERADLCIDTSGLSAAGLRRKVAAELLEPTHTGKLAVTFTSFGHKHGPPRDADLAFDVRFLPNPHYEADLRPLTGFDERDRRLRRARRPAGGVLRAASCRCSSTCSRSTSPRARPTCVVAIGCTGGRHRSVAIAEHLAARFRDVPDYFVEVQHRDVDRLPVR